VSLFNMEKHRLLQSSQGWTSYYLLHPKNKVALAEIHFHFEDGLASSPFRSPFGSLEGLEGIPSEALFGFLEFVEQRIRLNGGKKVVIKNPPQAYDIDTQSVLTTFLVNQGYSISNAEMGAVISIDQPFENSLDSWERRKLKQGHEADLELREVSIDKVEEVYKFILARRIGKGYSISMTFDELKRTLQIFSDRFLPFGVYKQNTLIAASICIRVRSNVLYNFYSDHDKAMDHLSPIVFLMEGIHEYARLHKIALLDLGTSAYEGKPNFGLLDFKLRLGAKPTMKLTFEKLFN